MKWLALFVFLIVVMQSCTFDLANPTPLNYQCDTVTITYEKDIFPIMDQSCDGAGPGTGCHSWVFDYPRLTTEKLKSFIDRTLDVRDMPPRENQFDIPQLTFEELQTIHCWIEQGYPEK